MRKVTLVLMAIIYFSGTIMAQRKMENLGRGVVAIRTASNSAFVSWRLLGTDPRDLGFNLYRSTDGGAAAKLNTSVLTDGTNFTDNAADLTKANAYFVKPVVNGIEQSASSSYTLVANTAIEPCIRVLLQTVADHWIQLAWVGDLDGDGEYEFVILRNPTDTAQLGTCLVEAYKRDGTFLWRIDQGPNSNNKGNTEYEGRPSTLGAGNWDGLTVYDLDCDGKAEVMIRTANGVIFGDGTTLTVSDNNAQFISVVNGFTGAEKARIGWPTDYISDGTMSQNFGIGYLNGITPSLVVKAKNRKADGSFNLMYAAYDYNGTSITLKWKWLRGEQTYYTQSLADGHQFRVVDVNGDGKDEVCDIGFCLKGDGTILYSLDGIGHGDRFHVGKLDPNRPGLQGYGIQQYNSNGTLEYYYDAGTGQILWRHTTINAGDAGRGVACDIDPRYEGYEGWAFSGQYNLPTNTKLNNSNPYPNFRIWWDGDLLSENLNDGKVDKWNYINGTTGRVTTVWNSAGGVGTDRSAPQFYGDILGDWREEMIYVNTAANQLIIMCTPFASDYRIYTLPHNPEYRNCMTMKGYQQSHMLDYFLGAGMSTPPTPPVQSAKSVWKGGLSGNIWDNVTANWLVSGANGTYTQGDDVMFDLSAYPDTTIQLTGSLTPSSIKVISPINYYFAGSGNITGATGLLKAGSGALSINTDCGYTDTTRVEEGIFYINANLTQSPLLVFWGATIGGNGTISKSVTLTRGAIVAPGTVKSVGTLSFSSGLAVSPRSSFMFDITDDSTGLIKPSDKIVVTGNLVISDTMTIKINKMDGKVKPGKYPLIAHTGSFTGNLSKVGITGLFGQKYRLKDSINTLFMIIEAARPASKVLWNGASDKWDLQATPAWSLNGSDVTFVPNDSVILDGYGSNNPSINVIGTLPVKDMMVETSNNNYSFSGSGVIGGTGGLTKKGIGTLSILNSNSFTGKTVIDSGKFVIGSLADAGIASSIGANTSTSPVDFSLNNAYLKYGGTTTISTNKGLTLNGTNDTLEVSNSGTILSISGVVTGTGNLVKAGAGILNFKTSANTYSGNTIIKGGILSLGDEMANTNGINTGSVTLDGGTLTMYSATSSYNHLANNLIVPAGSNGRLETDARCFLDGSLTGGGTLNFYVTYIRTEIAGDWSAFTGTINVLTDGTADFRFNNASGLPNAKVNFANACTAYSLSGGTFEIGEVSGIATSSMTSGAWVVGGIHTNATFDGVISGTSVTKKGTGSWTLSNANTYTGGTIVTGGTLIVKNTTGSGTGTGAVTINNGGTLAGTGIITGAITVNSGGAIAPGINATGTLSIANVTFTTGSSLTMEVNNTLNTKDMISSSGTIRLAGTLTIVKLDAGDFTSGNSYKILNATSIVGSFASITPAIPALGLGWDTTSLRTNGTIKFKPTQTITFGPLADKTFGDAAFSLTATVSSGLPLTYVSSDPLVATISGNIVTITGTGSVTITASQAGDNNYLPADNVSQSFTVSMGTQTIVFGSLSNKTFGDAAFDLTANGGASGNAITFVSSNTDVATISGKTVTIVGVGTATITASQVGNSNYKAAADVSQILMVDKASQTIVFGSLANKTFGDAAFDLTATGGTSGNAVTFVSSNTDVATIVGKTVTIAGAGTSTISASQTGNSNYHAAADVAQTLTIDKASQIISFSDLPSKKVGDAAFNLTATSSSGLPVSYASSNMGVATISGSTITIVSVGTTNITASQAGNSNYNGATDVVEPLNVISTGIVSLTDQDISIAPNPVSDALTVTLRIADPKATIEVYTLSGIQVYGEMVTDKIATILVSQFEPGSYFIKVKTSEGILIKQIIKQ